MRVKIDNKIYNLPMKQSEITWSMGKDLDTIQDIYESLDNDSACAEIASILASTDVSVMEQVDPEDLALIVDNHPFFHKKINIFFFNYFCYKGRIYQYIDFNKPMTVKEMMDIEYYIIDALEDKVFWHLYKKIPYFRTVSFLGLRIPFPELRILWYRILLKNHKDIGTIPYYQVKFSIHNFLQFKKKLQDDYSLSDNDSIPEDQKDDIVLEPTEFQKWGLYHVLKVYCDHNQRDFDYWLDKDIRVFFKALAHKNLCIVKENEEMKKRG